MYVYIYLVYIGYRYKINDVDTVVYIGYSNCVC